VFVWPSQRSCFTESGQFEKYLKDPQWKKRTWPPCVGCSLYRPWQWWRGEEAKFNNKCCNNKHRGCRHFDEWKYRGKSTFDKRSATDLKFAREALDGCWGHCEDGSDLVVSQSELFDRIFNQIIPLIEKVEKNLNEKFDEKD
jgi:hypothetical protein